MKTRKVFDILADFCVNFAAGLVFAAFAIPLASSGTVSEKVVVIVGDLSFAVAFLFVAYKMKL